MQKKDVCIGKGCVGELSGFYRWNVSRRQREIIIDSYREIIIDSYI